MPGLSAADSAKLAALVAMTRAGLSPRVVEFVGFVWPAPTGAIYYSSAPVTDLAPNLQLEPVELRLSWAPDAPFREIIHDAGISDDKIDLDLWDADGRISDLFQEHGPGVRVEVYYYFPEVDLLLPVWWGHLQPPEDADEERFTCTAEQGFRSSNIQLPRRAYFITCQALYPPEAGITTQAEIDEGDCPVNIHIGGSVGLVDPDTGLFYPTCPRNSRGECAKRVGTVLPLPYLAFDTVIESIPNNQTEGGTLYATSRGNENNLKRALRVFAGERVARDCDVIRYTPQYNNNHPDEGFVRVEMAVGEGPLQSMRTVKVNDTPIKFEHLNIRLGEKRQPATNFSPNAANDSGTAKFYAVHGPVDPSTLPPSSLRGEAAVQGLRDVRVYTDETTYTEMYSRDRAWWLLHCLRNKRWGYGLDTSRLAIQEDFVDVLAPWCAQTVAFTQADGTLVTGQRTLFDAELTDRSVQQQINDICIAGRFGLPFAHGGKLRNVPLTKVADLSACPVFFDDGSDRNIVRAEGGKSSLRRSIMSDAELPNRWVVTFDDAERGNLERPLTFEDVLQQLKAGRAFGDNTRRVVEKKISLLGVTRILEAGRLGNLLLDLGELDEGGLVNNLRISFVTWFAFTLDLHKYKVIRVVSRQLERYGFEYFRIRSMKRLPNLQVAISAQAYPVDYYEAMENVAVAPTIIGTTGEDNDGGRRGDRPFSIGFTSVLHNRDRIEMQLGY